MLVIGEDCVSWCCAQTASLLGVFKRIKYVKIVHMLLLLMEKFFLIYLQCLCSWRTENIQYNGSGCDRTQGTVNREGGNTNSWVEAKFGQSGEQYSITLRMKAL